MSLASITCLNDGSGCQCWLLWQRDLSRLALGLFIWYWFQSDWDHKERASLSVQALLSFSPHQIYFSPLAKQIIGPQSDAVQERTTLGDGYKEMWVNVGHYCKSLPHWEHSKCTMDIGYYFSKAFLSFHFKTTWLWSPENFVPVLLCH